jgi:hypothetical protein
MDMAIPNSANSEVHSVIRFLNVKEVPAKFHQIVSVYGGIMNKLLLFMVIYNRQDVVKWCHEFNAGL